MEQHQLSIHEMIFYKTDVSLPSQSVSICYVKYLCGLLTTLMRCKAIYILLALIWSQYIFSQEKIYIDYVDKFDVSDSVQVSLPILNKANRLKSNSAISFKIEHDENVPDSVVKSLKVASDVWRSCLKINSAYQIKLKLVWQELADDEDVRISVAYVPDAIFKNYSPTSLHNSLLNSPSLDSDSPDALITVNKNKVWDCGYNIDNNIGVRNLSYAMLRSIAVALGFGSSLSYAHLSTGDIVKFPFSGGHSLFDNILVSENGIRLNEIYNTGRVQNPDILKFCTGGFGNVYIDGLNIHDNSDSPYKMYTPSNYEKNKSLIFLDNSRSLMHYSMDKSAKILQIDTATINILNKIGWSIYVPNDNFQIKGNDIPESGITSAYTSHSFYIEGNNTDDIKNGEWSFWLPSSVDGSDILIKTTDGGSVFNIEPIVENESYQVSVNGDIYGKIVFTGIFNGKNIKLQYNITLELKPLISDVSFVKQKNKGKDSYNVSCKVDYTGANYLFVTLEEEYGSTLRSQFVREPYLAHFSCKNITSPYYAWIDIIAENKYGKELYTIELPPYVEQPMKSDLKRLDSKRIYGDFSEIKVFNTDGHYLKAINDFSAPLSLSPGIYILEFYQNEEKVKTSKLLMR